METAKRGRSYSGLSWQKLAAVLLCFAALPLPSLASELEVVDDLRVDGYTAMVDSAAVEGSSFLVGDSTFSARSGKVGIGTAQPSFLIHVSSGAGVPGELLVISTGSSNVIRMNGKGEIYANRFYGDMSSVTGGASGDDLGSHTATETLKMSGFAITGAGAGTLGGVLTVNGSSATVTGKDPSSGYSLLLSSGLNAASGTIIVGYMDAAMLSGNGAQLTALNASALASGTIADARLSSNVDLLNAAQTLSAPKTFSSSVTVTEARGIWTPALTMRAGVSISSATAAQGGGIYVSSNIYADGSVRSSVSGFRSADAAYGITPARVGTWISNSGLANVTDGDLSTVSATGNTTATGSFSSNYIKVTLTGIFRGILFLQGGMWNASAGGSVTMRMGFSQDSSSYYWNSTSVTYSNCTSECPVFIAYPFSGQYLSVHCYTSSSANAANCKFYDLVAAIYQ